MDRESCQSQSQLTLSSAVGGSSLRLIAAEYVFASSYTSRPESQNLVFIPTCSLSLLLEQLETVDSAVEMVGAAMRASIPNDTILGTDSSPRARLY